MLSPSYPYATEDKTEPYLAKLVKDLAKDYKENRNWIYRSQYFFFKDCLYKGLYCGRKGKRYVMEVVTTAEKLPPDDLEDVKDNLGEA